MSISKISEIYKNYDDDFFVPVLKFEKEQYKEALMGGDTFKGFYQVMNDYRGWKNTDLVKFYTGICLIKTKDYENGIGYLTNITLREPLMECKKHIFLGDTYTELNKYEEAIKYYQKATNIYTNDTDNVDAMYKIILCYEKMKKYNEALKVVREAIGKYPDMARYKDFIKKKTQLESIEEGNK
ncbi:MAG: tetratricopeptide repeat protein [Cytophagales bacterium]|nr:tetratricopeptide repeat protein [Cytophagales bacterium]